MIDKDKLLKSLYANKGFLHLVLTEFEGVTLTELKSVIAEDPELVIALNETEELRLSEVRHAIFEQCKNGGGATLQALYLQNPSLFSAQIQLNEMVDLSVLSDQELNALKSLIDKVR